MPFYEIIEKDEAGNVTATYVRDDAVGKKGAGAGGERVDVIVPQASKNYAHQLLDVFLPTGFPASVTDDYIHYQIYDSLQAFSSSIAGMLASRAILEGVGVGDSTATPTTALLLSVIQTSVGQIATILFAHRLGTALEPECKMYRLAADVFNDTAMVLDCLSPAFPKSIRVAVLSFSSCLRALCGVCAGSSKASLSAHFAHKGNLGEVNAKDSSQETVISLLGMLAGSLVVSQITSPLATWGTLILLLTIHLATNYAAVRAVNMHCLNRQRANILFSNMFQHGLVLSPRDVSQRERVFERGGVLRWSDDKVLGRCSIGVPLQRLLNRLGTPHQQTGSLTLKSMEISDLLEVFANEAYILLPASTADEALIVLKGTCEPIDQIKAWAHALLLAKRREGLGSAVLARKPDDGSHRPAMEGLISELRESLKEVQALFERYGDEMRGKGWDMGVAALETQAGVRLQID